MSLSNTENKITYSPSTATTSFSYPYAFFDDSTIDTPNGKVGDIKVTLLLTSTSTPTALVPTASDSPSAGEFNVRSTNGDPAQGAVITTGTSYTSGATISIEREVKLTQDYDLQEGATIDPTALNKAFDRVVAQNQQQQEDIAQAITFPDSDSGITYNITDSAANRAGKVIGFDANGNVTPLAVSSVTTGSGTTLAGGNGITVNGGTVSVNNDSDHIGFDGSGKLKVVTDGITATEIATDAVETAKIKDDAVTPAKISSVTGTDANIVTGTAGTNGNLLKWDANGDAIDSGFNVTDNDNLGTSDTTLATQGNIKAYVNSLIPRCIVLDGSGAVTVGGQTGVSGVDDISSGAISNNYLDYFIKTTGSGAIDMMYNASSAPSNGQILTVPLSGLTSTKQTIVSTNIIGMWVRPQLQVDAHDETGIIDLLNPQVKIEYYMPRGQNDVSTLNDTNYRYDAIGWRRESEGGQLSNINSMVYIPVNARSGGQPSVQFRFGMKVKSGSLTMRAGLTLHAVNVVGLTT
jgi:hypothetical protein